MSEFSPPGYCPNCGDFVPLGTSSCDACGSCPQTGWNEDSAYDDLDLPDAECEKPSQGPRIALRALGAFLLLAVLVYVYVFR